MRSVNIIISVIKPRKVMGYL